MKLYTEEQVIEFTMAMISQYEFGNKNIHNRELLKESLDNKKPIELPSDEEIKEFILKNYYNRDTSHQAGFLKGADWMREQILNQNK